MREALEAALRDVMTVLARELPDVQRDSGVQREGLEELHHELRVEAADLLRLKRDIAIETATAADVHRHEDKRLIHRQRHARIAPNPLPVAERLRHRLPERDPDVLHTVMIIDPGVSLAAQIHLNPRMPAEQRHHMIEEPDPRLDLRLLAIPVEVQPQLHIRLIRHPIDLCYSHIHSLFLMGSDPITAALRFS